MSVNKWNHGRKKNEQSPINVKIPATISWYNPSNCAYRSARSSGVSFFSSCSSFLSFSRPHPLTQLTMESNTQDSSLTKSSATITTHHLHQEVAQVFELISHDCYKSNKRKSKPISISKKLQQLHHQQTPLEKYLTISDPMVAEIEVGIEEFVAHHLSWKQKICDPYDDSDEKMGSICMMRSMSINWALLTTN